MAYDRQRGHSGHNDDSTHDHGGQAPGRRTLTQSLPVRSHNAEAAAAPVGAADAGQPVPESSKKVKVSVTSLDKAPAAGTPISFDAANYAGLYQQVKARADAGQEAGSVSRGWSEDYVTPEGSDDAIEAKYDIPLTMSLPKWTKRDTQPAEDQKKYDGWAASVKTHEDQHVAIYRAQYAALKTSVIGPKTGDCSTQATAVDTAAETAQQTFDNSNQPAGLPIPGGTEKVKSSGTAVEGNGGAEGAEPGPNTPA